MLTLKVNNILGAVTKNGSNFLKSCVKIITVGTSVLNLFQAQNFNFREQYLIHHHVDYVIGMRQPINDVAAIKFATGFYDALGAGRNYDDAFSMGRTCFNSTSVTGYSGSSLPVMLNCQFDRGNS